MLLSVYTDTKKYRTSTLKTTKAIFLLHKIFQAKTYLLYKVETYIIYALQKGNSDSTISGVKFFIRTNFKAKFAAIITLS